MQEQTQQPATSPQVPWAGFGYRPVRGLVDRHIARFLRTQRKNMRRFFAERGHLDLFSQLDELRKNSRADFRRKNEIFQRILNEHIARTVPGVPTGHDVAGQTERSGQLEAVVSEAADPTVAGVVDVPVVSGVPTEYEGLQPDGVGTNTNGSVQAMATGDGSDGVVIEE